MELDHRKRYASTGPDASHSVPTPGKRTLTQGLVQMHPAAAPSSERSEPATAPPPPVPSGARPTLQMLFGRRARRRIRSKCTPRPRAARRPRPANCRTSSRSSARSASTTFPACTHTSAPRQRRARRRWARPRTRRGTTSCSALGRTCTPWRTRRRTSFSSVAACSSRGGVGEVGDAYERQADEVADHVVQGRSAEALLDRYAAPSEAASSAVQRIILTKARKPFKNFGAVIGQVTARGIEHHWSLVLEGPRGPSRLRHRHDLQGPRRHGVKNEEQATGSAGASVRGQH